MKRLMTFDPSHVCILDDVDKEQNLDTLFQND